MKWAVVVADTIGGENASPAQSTRHFDSDLVSEPIRLTAEWFFVELDSSRRNGESFGLRRNLTFRVRPEVRVHRYCRALVPRSSPRRDRFDAQATLPQHGHGWQCSMLLLGIRRNRFVRVLGVLLA